MAPSYRVKDKKTQCHQLSHFTMCLRHAYIDNKHPDKEQAKLFITRMFVRCGNRTQDPWRKSGALLLHRRVSCTSIGFGFSLNGSSDDSINDFGVF